MKFFRVNSPRDLDILTQAIDYLTFLNQLEVLWWTTACLYNVRHLILKLLFSNNHISKKSCRYLSITNQPLVFILPISEDSSLSITQVILNIFLEWIKILLSEYFYTANLHPFH